jgi:hypothetical protein
MASAPVRWVAGEVDAGIFAEFVEAVVGLDDSNGARLRAHHDRLCVGTAAAVAHTAQQVTIGDTGGGEEHVLPWHQVLGRENPVEVVPGVDRLLPCEVISGCQTRLQDPTH